MSIATANFQTATMAPWGATGVAEGGERVLRPQEPLFHEGDDTRYLYEIVEGVVCAYKVFLDGRRQVISFAYPGELVGFGHGTTYRFSCVALGTTKVRPLAKNSLLRAVKDRPELSERLLGVAANEVASMRNLSILLGRKSALEKLASFFVDMAERVAGEDASGPITLPLPMSRADIADFLGLTIETVSRNVTRLRLMKIVSVPQRTALVVHELKRLRELAECDECIH